MGCARPDSPSGRTTTQTVSSRRRSFRPPGTLGRSATAWHLGEQLDDSSRVLPNHLSVLTLWPTARRKRWPPLSLLNTEHQVSTTQRDDTHVQDLAPPPVRAPRQDRQAAPRENSQMSVSPSRRAVFPTIIRVRVRDSQTAPSVGEARSRCGASPSWRPGRRLM